MPLSESDLKKVSTTTILLNESIQSNKKNGVENIFFLN